MQPRRLSICNMQFCNPVYFIAAAVLLAIGVRAGWIDRRELLLAAALLLIPYFTIAHKNAMASCARYAMVVFPAFIVLGHIFMRLPCWLVGLACAVLGSLMAVYAALFAAQYPFT